MWHNEFQLYNIDIDDTCLAILLSAYCTEVKVYIKTEEQYNKFVDLENMLINSYSNYYYAYGNNYIEFNENVKELDEPIQEDCNFNGFNEWKRILKDPILEEDYDFEGDDRIITITGANGENLKQLFDSYFKKHDEGDLNADWNILTIKAQNERLYKLLTEQDYNLTFFHVTDISYIKPICYALYKGLIYIFDLKLEFDEDFNIVSFDCYADYTGFVDFMRNNNDKQQKTRPKNKPLKLIRKRNSFSPSVQDLYDYIKRYAPAKNYEIYKEDLIGENRRNKLYHGMGELTTAVNRLNKQYKEIYNTDITLMKYDKFLDCYVITDIWNN